MASRIDLQTQLEAILGTRNVYYQPPESIKLKYPCIIYSLNRIRSTKANNSNYNKNKSYELILIDSNPDSELVDSILDMQYCSFDRQYKADNLYHFVFTIYY